MSLEAGQYFGGVGSIMVQPLRGPTELARSGLAFRQNIVDDYLGRAGLTTRGDGHGTRLSTGALGRPSPMQLRSVNLGNICDGGGAAGAAILTGAGGSTGFLSTTAASTGDAGWTQAGSIAGALAAMAGSVLGTVNQRDCDAITAAQSQQTPSQGTGDATFAQYQAALAAAMAQTQTAMTQQDGAALAAQQQAAQTQRYMLIGGGVLAAVLVVGVGIAVFRK